MNFNLFHITQKENSRSAIPSFPSKQLTIVYWWSLVSIFFSSWIPMVLYILIVPLLIRDIRTVVRALGEIGRNSKRTLFALLILMPMHIIVSLRHPMDCIFSYSSYIVMLFFITYGGYLIETVRNGNDSSTLGGIQIAFVYIYSSFVFSYSISSPISCGSLKTPFDYLINDISTHFLPFLIWTLLFSYLEIKLLVIMATRKREELDGLILAWFFILFTNAFAFHHVGGCGWESYSGRWMYYSIVLAAIWAFATRLSLGRTLMYLLYGYWLLEAALFYHTSFSNRSSKWMELLIDDVTRRSTSWLLMTAIVFLMMVPGFLRRNRNTGNH